VSWLQGRDGPQLVESALAALVRAGHTRTDATGLLIERLLTDARAATTVVVVEGLSDQIVLETLAERHGRALRTDGTHVVPAGGATNFARILAVFGPRGRDVRLAGLYDSPVEDRIRRSLVSATVVPAGGSADLEAYGFYRCVTDIEHEMIRALGPTRVEEVVAGEGDLRSFRRLQKMPYHRQRPLEQQLHRFIAAHSGAKYRYARVLASALEPNGLPPPLARVLEHV